MRKLRALWMRFIGLLRPGRADAEFRAELESHVAMDTEEGIRAGFSPEEARRQALIRLGGAEQTRQSYRERGTLPWLESLAQDVRYALRQMRKAPGFTLTAVLTLVLGIGANAAIFSVFDNVLLRNLHVRKPGDLVLLSEHSRFDTGRLSTTGGGSDLYFSYPAYEAMQRDNHVLSEMAVSSNRSAIVDAGSGPSYAGMAFVSGNYFDLMGVQALLGRTLTPADDRLDEANAVAVLSEGYWKSHFGGDPEILNRTLKINGETFTIVGVVRHRGLMDGEPADLFVPVGILSVEQMGDYTTAGRMNVLSDPLNSWLNIIGRLAPGATRAGAEEQLNGSWLKWRRDALVVAKDNIPDKQGWMQTHLSLSAGARGISLLEHDFGEPLKVLLTMALLVLLIACGNVANLLLAKAARRDGELAVRGALGASRGRIFQQVIVEGLLLGLLGAAAGMALGGVSLRALMATVVPLEGRLRLALTGGMNGRTIVFCALAGIVTSVMFSLAPAVLSMRVDLQRALHMQSAAVAAGGGRMRNLLVAGQIALTLTLIVGAAVFGWNLYQLSKIRPGFATSHLLTFDTDASAVGRDKAEIRNDYESIEAALVRLPGVYGATYAKEGFITDNTSGSDVTVAGYVTPKNNEMVPDQNWVSPGFFSTMQIPLLAGRVFSAQDSATAQKVAIVDEAFVEHYFGGDVRKALGGRFGFGSGDHVKMEIEIVGVLPTIRATSLTSAPPVPFLYLPYDQTYEIQRASRAAYFYLRTTGDPATLAVAVRALVHRVDPSLILGTPETMREHLSEVTYAPRMVTVLSLAMGGLALALAALGLYGLLMLVVVQRTREIGIRMALGADRAHISTLIARLVCGLMLPGMAAGGALGWVGVHLLAHRDANLAQTPPWLFAAAAIVLIVAMSLAAVLPARRAARIDPMQALRSD